LSAKGERALKREEGAQNTKEGGTYEKFFKGTIRKCCEKHYAYEKNKVQFYSKITLYFREKFI